MVKNPLFLKSYGPINETYVKRMLGGLLGKFKTSSVDYNYKTSLWSVYYQKRGISLDMKTSNLPPSIRFKSLSEINNIKEIVTRDLVSLMKPDMLPYPQAGINGLDSMVSYYFNLNGKMVRPITLMHLSNVISGNVSEGSYLIALVSEAMHTATLYHDDILDEATLRRSATSVNQKYGEHNALMAGSYLLSQCSRRLAMLKNSGVIRIYANIIDTLIHGELQQAFNKPKQGSTKSNHNKRIDDRYISGDGYEYSKSRVDELFLPYLTKSFNKTASLLANGCLATAYYETHGCIKEVTVDVTNNTISKEGTLEEYIATSFAGNDNNTAKLKNYLGDPSSVAYLAYEFGKNVGMAFQVIDDLLDWGNDYQAEVVINKDTHVDIRLGILTAPLLFARLEYNAELSPMIIRKFKGPTDLKDAIEYVKRADGINKSYNLANEFTQRAITCLNKIHHITNKTQPIEGVKSHAFLLSFTNSLLFRKQ